MNSNGDGSNLMNRENNEQIGNRNQDLWLIAGLDAQANQEKNVDTIRIKGVSDDLQTM